MKTYSSLAALVVGLLVAMAAIDVDEDHRSAGHRCRAWLSLARTHDDTVKVYDRQAAYRTLQGDIYCADKLPVIPGVDRSLLGAQNELLPSRERRR